MSPSSSSSSNNFREEMQTTTGELSKSVSHRSFSRGGFASERKYSKNQQAKTDRTENYNNLNETRYPRRK